MSRHGGTSPAHVISHTGDMVGGSMWETLEVAPPPGGCVLANCSNSSSSFQPYASLHIWLLWQQSWRKTIHALTSSPLTYTRTEILISYTHITTLRQQQYLINMILKHTLWLTFHVKFALQETWICTWNSHRHVNCSVLHTLILAGYFIRYMFYQIVPPPSGTWALVSIASFFLFGWQKTLPPSTAVEMTCSNYTQQTGLPSADSGLSFKHVPPIMVNGLLNVGKMTLREGFLPFLSPVPQGP